MAPEKTKEQGEQQQGQKPPEGEQQPPAGQEGIRIEGTLEEPGKPAEGSQNGEQGHATKTFSVEDIEKARREEKDKLYGSMDEMKKELSELRKFREAQAKAEEEAKKRSDAEEAKRAAEAKKKAEEEMELRELLASKEQEWDQRFQSIEQERQVERELLDKERRFTELQKYRLSRIEAEAEHVMPELRDFVAQGPDEAAIEASIEMVKQKTMSVLDQMTAAQQAARQQQRGTTPTAPPVGPMEQQQEFQNLTADDLRNMDMATYSKNRERLLGAVSDQVRSRGPYSR